MKYATTCKFCKKSLVLTIDDDYAKLGDPMKLIPMAACNICADLRIRRRFLEDKIENSCYELIHGKRNSEAITKTKSTLTILTKSYSRLIAEWVHSATPFWDVECVNLLVEKPNHWSKILSMLWKGYETA